MFYIPMLPVYIGCVLYTRKLLYFTAANPAIEMGGFFGEKKDEILALISDKFKPKSILISKLRSKMVEELLRSTGINYPVIAKPNVGERGYNVKLINMPSGLDKYITESEDESIIIQEYANQELELGILFQKHPETGEVNIRSITEKKFLKVTGNGTSTVEELLLNDKRGRLYLNYVKTAIPKAIKKVPDKNEPFVVHRIGNHAKGTRFINANKHISRILENGVAQIVKDIEGVYYARLDLKVDSYVKLEQALSCSVFEMNGVSSEAGHIYDLPSYFHATKDITKEWIAIAHICRMNIKKGVQTTPLRLFLTQVFDHFNLY